jgi:hypothetical protein
MLQHHDACDAFRCGRGVAAQHVLLDPRLQQRNAVADGSISPCFLIPLPARETVVGLARGAIEIVGFHFLGDADENVGDQGVVVAAMAPFGDDRDGDIDRVRDFDDGLRQIELLRRLDAARQVEDRPLAQSGLGRLADDAFP